MLFAKVSLAQKDSVYVYTGTETGAQFPGGLIAQNKFISDNFIYPTVAKENGFTGTCFVSFEIDTVGHINKIKVVKGIRNCIECDEEAKRLISIMPNWIPATVNKRPQVCRIKYCSN
jgi:protein TonB